VIKIVLLRNNLDHPFMVVWSRITFSR